MCSKTCFTKHEADAALKRTRTGKQYRREQRAYYCRDCKAWHLTSQANMFENLVEDFELSFKRKWKKLLYNKIL